MKGILENEDVAVSDKVTQIMSGYNTSINGLKVKNQELLGSEKKLKESITGYQTEKTSFEEQIATLTEQLKEKVNDKSKEDFYNNELAKKQKTFDDEIAKLSAERDEFKKFKIDYLKNNAISKGVEGLKFVNEAYKEGFIQLCLARNNFQPTEIDGQTVFLNSEQKQISDVIKEFALTETGKAFIANGTTGGGATGNVKPTGSTENPWKKETRNLGKQMQMFKDNPELARKLAKEAGITL